MFTYLVRFSFIFLLPLEYTMYMCKVSVYINNPFNSKYPEPLRPEWSSLFLDVEHTKQVCWVKGLTSLLSATYIHQMCICVNVCMMCMYMFRWCGIQSPSSLKTHTVKKHEYSTQTTYTDSTPTSTITSNAVYQARKSFYLGVFDFAT